MNFLLPLIVSFISLTITVEAKSIGKRTCRIIFPERPKNATKIAHLFDGKKSHQVFLPSRNFSPIIELPEGELNILMTPNAITDLKNLPPEAPSLKIPKNVMDFYILVTSDPENSVLPLQMEIIRLSDGELTAGETLWINHTDHQIKVKLGESKILITPRGQQASKSPISTSGYYRAEFSYKKNAIGDFKKITEQSWWHDMKSRHLGFIVNKGEQLPSIFLYRDFRTQIATTKEKQE
jgi:hypothetical protein